MLPMGRPREKGKDLPLGVYPVKGRFYVRPVNEEMRRIFAVAFPGKRCAPLGSDKSDARKKWVKIFATDVPAETASAGTVAELLERYERDILPTLAGPTKSARTSYCKTLKAAFGTMRYARSEAEAATGSFLRSMNLTAYLDVEAKRKVFDKEGRLLHEGRPVAANREIEFLSRVFRIAKARWGYTEYNPCLQVEYNPETPREEYHDDALYMKVYEKASPKMQCAMDLAQMNGARRGMILRLTLADVDGNGPGVWFTLNKRKRDAKQKRKLAPWTDDLRSVIARALEIRSKVRGGQREVKDLDTAPLFLSRKGKAWGTSAFNTDWQRSRRVAGFGKHTFHFHDIKAKALSDSPDLMNAMERGDHTEIRTTKTVYRRKPASVTPLPAVSRKKNA